MPKKKKNVNKSLSEAAKLLGHAGGRVGGPARALKLSKTEREEIARQGAKAKAAKAMARNKGKKAINKAHKETEKKREKK